jgi:prepilin-type processing-associated H-X9-DG protein
MLMSSDVPTRRISAAAAASLVLGLLSPVLSLLAAIPAVIVGVQALRAINASDGRLRGRPLAIAGMLLGGLVAAITVAGVGVILVLRLNSYRDRVECANHQRSIGVAVKTYCDTHEDTFPVGTVVAPRLAPAQRLSWLAAILPYLDEGRTGARPWQGLAGQLHPDLPWDDPANQADRARIRTFLCRAAAAAEVFQPPGLTTYVGLAGINPDAATLPKASPRAGFFGYERTITPADLLAGSSFTMTAIETGQDNGPWAAGGPATVRGVDPDQSHYLGRGRPFGGLHQGGTNILWADGSVRFTSDSFPAAEFRAQATLVGHSREGP